MIQTAICEMLGIKYPVFQGGMAWIADGKLAAAVSNGGGLGIIAAGNAPGNYVRQQIQVARSITSKPIGVNIMLLSPFADEVAKVVIEEHVEVVTTGAGNTRQAKTISPDVYLMKHITAPGVLLECGFLSNPAELRNLKDPGYQNRLAVTIAVTAAGYRPENFSGV